MKQVNVLGEIYTIRESNPEECPVLNDCDGYCDNTVKVCVVDSVMHEGDPSAKLDMKAVKNKIIRHEVVHAFLFESGLAENSWAANEEIVDWIASMFPKLKIAFEQLNVG